MGAIPHYVHWPCPHQEGGMYGECALEDGNIEGPLKHLTTRYPIIIGYRQKFIALCDNFVMQIRHREAYHHKVLEINARWYGPPLRCIHGVRAFIVTCVGSVVTA